MANTYGHAVRRAYADEAYRSNDGLPRECVVRSCEHLVRFVCSYYYTSQGREKRQERCVCRSHAQRYARRHMLPWPPREDQR